MESFWKSQVLVYSSWTISRVNTLASISTRATVCDIFLCVRGILIFEMIFFNLERHQTYRRARRGHDTSVPTPSISTLPTLALGALGHVYPGERAHPVCRAHASRGPASLSTDAPSLS